MIKGIRIKGKHIAITGILNFCKRADAFERIAERGGIPQEVVTKSTDYLVVGYYRANTIRGEKSNKHLLAEKYIRQGEKIEIIREDEFMGMLWWPEPSDKAGRGQDFKII